MELIYSMRRKPLSCEPPYFESASDPEIIRPICTISITNIIAFSSPTKLSDTDGDTWGGHVYVCDLDTPWDSHKVTSTTHPITVLEWDSEGKQLLVATTVGDVSVYGEKDYLLNEWTCLYSASFPGEHIIKTVFFHNGRRIVYLDKKTDALLTDRIQVLRSTPTLKGFGGIACEGACIVTATGLIGALTQSTCTSETQQALTATECLRPTRDHITCASFAHKNGNLVVAAVCGGGGGARGVCVRCWACAVTHVPHSPRRLALALQPLPTIYTDDVAISASISWCSREDTDSLLVSGTTLTLWKLTERAHPVHKLLSKGSIQGNTTPGGGQKPPTDCFNTLSWQHSGSWSVERGHVAACRVSLGAQHAALATPHALHLLARDNHHLICSLPLVSYTNTAVVGSPPKKLKYGSGQLPSGAPSATFSCVDLSWLGGVAVAVDTHAQLHVYRIHQPGSELSTSLSIQHVVTLLEYSMVTGCDCLDILLTLKPNIAECVYERLTENFHRQPQAFQQYYYHSWLKLRVALCRMSSSWSGSVSWLTCVQAVSAGAAACGAALRADERADCTPLAALAMLLDDTAHEHDKSLLALEAKPEVTGDTGALQALQALRRVLQRVVHIALTVLAAVGSSGHHQPYGYELWSDPTALTLLRKMMVCVRACGRGGDALCRPLSRLAASATQKADLIDECATLSAQSSGRVWEALPRCTVSTPHARPYPIYFEYGVEPEALRFMPEPPAYAQCDAAPAPALHMDSIRYMYLGGGPRPARWRQCSRCGARALPAAHTARHPLQRAYDARFLPACRCGGKWTLFSNIDAVIK